MVAKKSGNGAQKLGLSQMYFTCGGSRPFLLTLMIRTSTRMHGEFLRLLFLQAHRETEAHFTDAGMSSQRNQSDSFRFKRATFYRSLKSKVGLAAAKAAALRINLLSRSPSPPPPSFTQSPSAPRSLVRDGQTSPHRPRLVVYRSTCAPLSPYPHANSFIIGTAEINTHVRSGRKFKIKVCFG
jgi:hypothetical protein